VAEGSRPLSDTRSPIRTLVAATLSKHTVALPVFLVGGLAVFIRPELQFGEAQLGLVVASYYAASAVASVPGGRLAERVGADRTMRIGGILTGVALLGIAATATTWGALVLYLVIAGVANGVAQPANNLALSRSIPRSWQGLAFGLKQSANPAATLLAGSSVPLLGLTIGWRWAFAAAVLLVLAFFVAAPRHVALERPRSRAIGHATPGLVALAVASAFATGAASAMNAFYVEASVAAGMNEGAAGAWLVLGGLCGIAGRIIWGRLGDHIDHWHAHVVATLMAFGALGFVLFGLAPSTLTRLIGTVAAFGAGWGWNGLFVFAVVRGNRQAPAAATGITQLGVYVGGVVGPLVFGLIVQHLSYYLAWFAGAVSLGAAGCFVVLGARLLRRDSVPHEAG
jgi:MFS family permease